MLNLFESHYSELMQSDLEQKTKDWNWQIVISYCLFLNGRPPDVAIGFLNDSSGLTT